MPDIHLTGNDVYSVSLTEDEAQTFEAMAKVGNVSIEQVLIDSLAIAYERAKAALDTKGMGELFSEETLLPEHVFTLPLPDVYRDMQFTAFDLEAINAILNMSLREALTLVLFKRSCKGD